MGVRFSLMIGAGVGRSLCLLCLLALTAAGPCLAAGDSAAPEQTDAEIVFIPPATGAPVDRLGAGTRDIAAANASVALIAPPQGGLTATDRPLLVWYFEAPVQGPVRVSITPVGGLGRAFVFTLEGRFAPGFHALNLARSQRALSPGQLYRWQVDWAAAAQTPAAWIEHRPVAAPFATASEAAAAGYWYDTVGFLFDVDFSGKLRLVAPEDLLAVSSGAGLDLTKIVQGRE